MTTYMSIIPPVSDDDPFTTISVPYCYPVVAILNNIYVYISSKLK